MRKFVITAVAAVLATAIASTSAFAANPLFCQFYAQKAVWSEHETLDYGCGLFGARWSFDYVGHYDWCLAVSKGMAQSETIARKWSLISCGV